MKPYHIFQKQLNSFLHWTKRFYFCTPVRINLISLFLTLFITTTIPSILVIHYFNTRTTTEEMKRSAEAAVQTASLRLEETIRGAKKISTSLLSNRVLQSLLKKEIENRSSADISSLESSLYTICATSTNHLSAYVYDLFDRCYYTDSFRSKTLSPSSLKENKHYERLQKEDGASFLVYSRELYQSTEEDGGLSVIRLVKNLDTLDLLGTLIINIRQEDVIAPFAGAHEKGSSFLIFDNSENILISINENPDFPPDTLLSIVSENNATLSKKKSGNSYLISSYYLEDFGLTVSSLTPTAVNSIGKQPYFKYLIAVLLINIAFLLAGLYILSKSLTSPLKKLALQMQGISDKDFQTIHTDYEEPNEIGFLTNCYNKMTQQIEALLKNEVEIQKNKRHLELNLLQAQFKPHFLYNTIDTARALCLQDDTKQANLLLKAMGSYYQNILSKGKNIISIEDELNTIKQYEIIRNFKDDFELNILYKAEERLLNYPILKFILQPLVENSIKHGFCSCDSGTILIQFTLEQDSLKILVKDNGMGIPDDIQKQICERYYKYEKDTASFGLRATIERMALFYGDDFNFEIKSLHNQGTSVLFTVQNYLRKEHLET